MIMRATTKGAVLGAAALAFLLGGFDGSAAHAQSKCHAGKLKCVVKKKSCLLGLASKELKTGVARDPAKVQKCIVGFGGSCDAGANVGAACHVDSECPGGTCAKGCFTKLEAKVPTPPDQPCPTSGDAAAIESKIDAFVNDVESELDQTPGANVQLCQAGKEKCVINYDKCVLGVHGKSIQKGLPLDTAKLDKCLQKFGGKCDAGANVGLGCVVDADCPGGTCAGGCFTKLELKGGCQTTNDVTALKNKADAFDNDVLSELTGAPPACPTQITFEGTSTDGVLDTGWTGQGHDALVVSDGMVTVSVTSCAGTAPNCGVCNYVGPIPNAAGNLDSGRCSNDSAIHCTPPNNAPCGAGTCKFFFGTYLPLSAGGVATCVENTFSGGISGTANVNTGTSAGAASLVSRVFSGPTSEAPCPRCVGDAVTNDGTKGGTCDSGAHSGGMCDANGATSNPFRGSTSLDCPPLGGGLIATLPIDLSNTTGTKTRTLSAASPNCRAIGFTTNKCQCDTCNNSAATPCSSNADCVAVGATVCGGKRCQGGANSGTPCTATSECPGGSCGVPGAATAPNQCDAGSGDCVADPGTPSPNDRVCQTGPFEQFCGPNATFQGCLSDSDCALYNKCNGGANNGAQCTANSACPGGACNSRVGGAPELCSVGKFRDCFDNGVAGDTVTATGNADPPAGHQSDPTLAALFCIGPTSSSAVNGAAGLPGLGRLELTGHSVDNGTPKGPCHAAAAREPPRRSSAAPSI